MSIVLSKCADIHINIVLIGERAKQARHSGLLNRD